MVDRKPCTVQCHFRTGLNISWGTREKKGIAPCLCGFPRAVSGLRMTQEAELHEPLASFNRVLSFFCNTGVSAGPAYSSDCE